jgi:putative aldouronate transport system permease protein
MFVFFTMLLNGGLVPWYFVCVRFLHINDTIWALILPYLMNGFYVIIMRTFFKTTIPDEVVESSRIDGSGVFNTFFRIVLPLSLPGLATIGLFTALQYWNDYFLPLMLINNNKLDNLQFMMYKILMTLEIIQNTPVGAVSDVYQKLPGETARMALAFLSMGPIILAYPFFQKYFIKGLTIGAVKG